MINKPRGVLTTVTDSGSRPTVLDLVPAGLRRALVPVGRLDFHTEGLLVLTDDGELAQRLSHPRYGCRKTYEVKVKGVPEPAALERLRRGVVLDGRRTAPCRIEPLRVTTVRGDERGNAWVKVELSEGRTRQIREMFFRIGHPVQKLKRTAIGPIVDRELPVGALRELTERELRILRGATAREKAPAAEPAGERPRRPRRTRTP